MSLAKIEGQDRFVKDREVIIIAQAMKTTPNELLGYCFEDYFFGGFICLSHALLTPSLAHMKSYPCFAIQRIITARWLALRPPLTTIILC